MLVNKNIILGLNLLALSLPINSVGYQHSIEPTFNIKLESKAKKKKFKNFDIFFKEFCEKRKQQEEKERKKKEELRLKELHRKQENEKYQEQIFELTFYSSLNCENGYGAITCEGKPLREGMVANNKIPLGTKIKLDGYDLVEVRDKGGKYFNNTYRLDVFVPRENEESKQEYYKRVQKMGRVKVRGRILKGDVYE